MPIYEYSCEDCQHVFEEWQKDFTDKEMVCPVCGGQAKRMISNTAFILKGSGWYATDYARNSSSSSGNGGNGGNGNGKESKSEDTSSTSKESTSSEKGGTSSSQSSDSTKTASTQSA